MAEEEGTLRTAFNENIVTALESIQSKEHCHNMGMDPTSSD